MSNSTAEQQREVFIRQLKISSLDDKINLCTNYLKNISLEEQLLEKGFFYKHVLFYYGHCLCEKALTLKEKRDDWLNAGKAQIEKVLGGLDKLLTEKNQQEELKERGKEARKCLSEPAVPSASATPPIPPTAPVVTQPSSIVSAVDYILMPQTRTYALGVEALRQACIQENNQNHPQITLPDGSKIYRANTFLENILARMNDWNTLKNPDGSERTLDERKRYFTTWLDSCCGIAYQAKTTKLKLQLVCPQLIGIPENFAEAFHPINYHSFTGQELDSSSRTFMRDGWHVLLEGRADVYNNYLEMLKEITGRDVTLNFWTRSKDNLGTDELRAVYVSNLDNFSSANGNVSLINFGRFLRRRSP